jgi:hypothetical protein
VDVPVALYREAQQHTDDLLREIVLMAAYETASGASGAASRLAAGAERHSARRDALAVTGERVVAAATGDSVTIEYVVDVGDADDATSWGEMLDEIGELCGSGVMLVVGKPDAVAFSRWFCEEFVRQLRDGAEPTPWPEYAAARRPG